MDITIRKARPQDGPQVAELINSVIDEGGLTALYPKLTAGQATEYIQNLGPRSIMILAELEGAVLGVQMVEPFATYTRAMDHVATLRTFVHRNFRRQGVGRKLIEATMAFARHAGYEKFVIYVRLGNAGAQRFYRQMGFIPKLMMERQVKIEGRYDDEMLMEFFVPQVEERAPARAEPAVVEPAVAEPLPVAEPAVKPIPEPQRAPATVILPPRPEATPAGEAPAGEAPAVEAPAVEAPAKLPSVQAPVAGAVIDPVVGAVTVRRARRGDLKTLTAIMRGTIRWRQPPSEQEVLDLLFDKGYWLAMSRKGGGVTGWRAENLVVCIDDFYVYPPQFYPQIGAPLLETIEEEAKALSCEVAIVFFDRRITPEAIKFFEANGYTRQELDDLFVIWREVAQEFVNENTIMLVKKLLEKRIMRPI